VDEECFDVAVEGFQKITFSQINILKITQLIGKIYTVANGISMKILCSLQGGAKQHI
jgi:hypothetical protein